MAIGDEGDDQVGFRIDDKLAAAGAAVAIRVKRKQISKHARRLGLLEVEPQTPGHGIGRRGLGAQGRRPTQATPAGLVGGHRPDSGIGQESRPGRGEVQPKAHQVVGAGDHPKGGMSQVEGIWRVVHRAGGAFGQHPPHDGELVVDLRRWRHVGIDQPGRLEHQLAHQLGEWPAGGAGRHFAGQQIAVVSIGVPGPRGEEQIMPTGLLDQIGSRCKGRHALLHLGRLVDQPGRMGEQMAKGGVLFAAAGELGQQRANRGREQ